jgi:outer membrane protein insertion porin family
MEGTYTAADEMSIAMLWELPRPITWVLPIVVLIVFALPSFSAASEFEANLPVVKEIEILGNRSYSDDVLKKRMRTKEPRFYHIIRKPRFRNDFLRRDIEAIKTFYRRNGFFDVEAWVEYVNRDAESNSVRIRIMVSEGLQTVVRTVEFTDQSIIPERELRKGLKLLEGEPYNPNLLDVDRYTLFAGFFGKGYLRTKIAYETTVDSTRVDISWSIDAGEPVKIADLKISGNETVDNRLIMRELTFERGEYFNLKIVLQSKQNLYDTGYFNSVEIEPTDIDMGGGGVDLALQVRERKMGYIETGLGVGNVHGNRTFIEWKQRNLLGRGWVSHLKTEYAFSLFPENEYSLSQMDFTERFMRHEGELQFPHVFSTWNTFAIGAFYERDATVQPTIVKTASATASIFRRFTRQTSILLTYALEHVRRQEVVDDEKEKSTRRSVDLAYTRDARDFYFNPRQGKYVNAKGRYSGGFLGGEDHFYSLVASYQAYKRLGKETVFAYRIRGGYAEAFGDSKETGVPLESRFFAGGGNSIRGYKENSLGPLGEEENALGGRVLLLTNVEVRFPLPYLSKYNFGGAAFLDAGNVWSSLEEIELKRFNPFAGSDDATPLDYRYSVGFGVRYNTPVGPIRLDMGIPLTKTPDIKRDYLFHISLGQIF